MSSWYILVCYNCRISCSTTRCTVTLRGGMHIHALSLGLRMMSFFMQRMPRARKRLSTGLWGVWNNRNAHVVDGALKTFGCDKRCVEWESPLFRCTMRARCYPFDMKNRQFHSFNPKVCQRVSIIHMTLYLYIT